MGSPGMAERSSAVTAFAWVLAAAWAALIWGLGSDDLSRDDTSSWFLPLLRTLLPFASEPVLAGIHFLARKTAHTAEYGVFAGLFWWATIRTGPGLGVRAVLAAFAASAVLAAGDEIRQSYSEVRSGALGDFALDLAGAAGVLTAAHHGRRWMDSRETAS